MSKSGCREWSFRSRVSGGYSIHDGLCKSDQKCTTDSIVGGARGWGGGGCNYFQENSSDFGLCGGAGWQIGQGKEDRREWRKGLRNELREDRYLTAWSKWDRAA